MAMTKVTVTQAKILLHTRRKLRAGLDAGKRNQPDNGMSE